MNEWGKAGMEVTEYSGENWIINPQPKLTTAWSSKMSLHVHNLKGHFYLLSILHFAHP